jgi:hypothetical protein
MVLSGRPDLHELALIHLAFRQCCVRVLSRLCWRSRTMVSEMLVLNQKVPFHVHMVAPQAPADDLAGVDVVTATLAMGHRSLLRVRKGHDLDQTFGQWLFRHLPSLLELVLWAFPKLYRAFAVVGAVHWKTADAFAVFSTVVVMRLHGAPMSMRSVRLKIFANVEFHDEPLLRSPLFGFH